MGEETIDTVRAGVLESFRFLNDPIQDGLDPSCRVGRRRFGRTRRSKTPDQFLDPLTPRRTDSYDVDPQTRRKPFTVDRDTPRSADVDHVDREDAGQHLSAALRQPD